MVIEVRHCNSLTVAEAEFLVIIQHCVHIFDPLGIYWSVEHDPLAVYRVNYSNKVQDVGLPGSVLLAHLLNISASTPSVHSLEIGSE